MRCNCKLACTPLFRQGAEAVKWRQAAPTQHRRPIRCLSATISPPTRPAAGLLPAAAGHRAAVDIIGDDVSGRGGLHVFCRRGCLTTMGSVTIGSLIPYQIVKQCVCTLSIGIGAIWDIETFDDSRLTAKFCVSGMRRSVQGLRCRALTTARSVCAVRG